MFLKGESKGFFKKCISLGKAPFWEEKVFSLFALVYSRHQSMFEFLFYLAADPFAALQFGAGFCCAVLGP